MSSTPRPLVYFARHGDGWQTRCRVCKTNSFRRHDRRCPSRTGDKACRPVRNFVEREDAAAYVEEHKASPAHRWALERARDMSPTAQESMLRAIFGGPPPPAPCPKCLQHHHRAVVCPDRERVRRPAKGAARPA